VSIEKPTVSGCAMSRRLLSWDDLARAQSTKFPFAMTLKDILEQAKNKDIIAARDRDSFDSPWRRVMLQKLAANIWLLLDEKGEVLDEPEDSCPSSGFSKETLFAEVGMEYYDFPIDKVDAQSKASDKLPTAGARRTEEVAGSSSASASASAPVSAPKPVTAVFRGGMAVSAVTKAVAPTMSSPKASAPKAPASKAPTAKATSALCAPCASPGGAHHGAPAPHYRRVHVRLNAWWETPDALRTWRLWAMEGLCGFPGCPLTDRHGGPHEFDPELIDLAR
jgi:hypothetical protein